MENRVPHKTMKGLWLEKNKLRLSGEISTPNLTLNEALIRTRLAGICGTDIQLVKGYYNFSGIPGHEFVGEVVECVSHPELIGKRVVGEINISCGHCEFCLQNQSTHCSRRSVLGIKNHHGVFAEYFTLPAKNLYTIPDTVSDEDAVFVEPIAAALRILKQVDIPQNIRVLVIGAGKLGHIIALVLKANSCNVTVVARHKRQQQLLEHNQINVILEKNVDQHQWDVVIEASGSPSGLEAALASVKPQGTIVLKSTYHDEASINLTSAVVNEITIIGSRCGPFKPAIEMLSTKKFNPGKLIEQIYSIDEAEQALKHSQAPGTQKIAIKFP